MKKLFLVLLITIPILFSCGKDNRCPYGSDQGCGCYNTGNPSEPGTANGWTPVYWDPFIFDCYWVDNIGNYRSVNPAYCTCQ